MAPWNPETGDWIDVDPEALGIHPESNDEPEETGDPSPDDEIVPSEPEGDEPGEPEPPPADEVNNEPEVDDDLAARLKKLEDQNAALHRRLSKGQKRQEATTPKPPEPLDDKDAPKLESFDTIEEFEAAKQAWEIDKRVNEGVRKALKTEPVDFSEEDRKEFNDKVMEEGPVKYSDFVDVVSDPTLPITVGIIDAVRESDNEKVDPADVFYYLGKNKAEAVRLSRMNPTQLAREMIKIETKIESAMQKAGPGGKETVPESGSKQPETKGKTVSSAPAPINPTDSTTIVVTKDPNKMSQREYEEWRKTGGGG